MKRTPDPIRARVRRAHARAQSNDVREKPEPLNTGAGGESREPIQPPEAENPPEGEPEETTEALEMEILSDIKTDETIDPTPPVTGNVETTERGAIDWLLRR